MENRQVPFDINFTREEKLYFNSLLELKDISKGIDKLNQHFKILIDSISKFENEPINEPKNEPKKTIKKTTKKGVKK